jgi:LmbE family N-acetylglucosaminyl deacetylase
MLEAWRKKYHRWRARGRQDGPFRYLVRDWSGLNDINLVRAVLETETFRKTVNPVPLPLSRVTSLLVLAPHQDDELIGAGGTMILARERQIDVNICFLTDGAQTGIGRQYGEAMKPHDVTVLRKREARAVCSRLEAGYHELGISNLDMEITPAHVMRLATLINDCRPDVIALPWLLDGTAKHRVASHLLWLALKQTKALPTHIWGFQVNNPLLPTGYVDITPAMAEKRALLELYRSQNDAIRRYDHICQGLNAWNSRFLPSKQVERAVHYVELFCALPEAIFSSLVADLYPRDFAMTYQNRRKLAKTMAALHQHFS